MWAGNPLCYCGVAMTERHEDDADQDVADVMREETHRGRRGVIDTDARRRKARLKAGLIELLEAGATEAEISEALTAVLGRAVGTPEHAAALRRWREY